MVSVHSTAVPRERTRPRSLSLDDQKGKSMTCVSGVRMARVAVVAIILTLVSSAAISPIVAAPLAKDAREECSKIALRFNGRITSLDVVARCWLLSIASVDSVEDEQGDPYDALSAWLAIAAKHSHATKLRMIPIDNARLQTLYGLKPRPAGASGRANLYAIAELLEHYAEFVAERQRIFDAKVAARPGATVKAPPLQAEDTPEYQDAIEQLHELLQRAMTHSDSFAGPAERTVEAFRDFQAIVARLEASNTPLVIAPQVSSESWRLYSSALFENLKIEILNDKSQQPHPGVAAWNKLLQAVSADESAEVIVAAKDLNKLNDSFQVVTPPYSFRTPDAWRERGAAAILGTHLYSDTLAQGVVVSSFEMGEGRRKCEVNVHYFPGSIASSARIINYWRYLQWNAPLETAALREHVEAVAVGGERAATVQVNQPAEYAGESRTSQVAILVKRDSDAMVLTLYGPTESVAEHRETFRAFAASVRISDSRSLAQWFPIVNQESRAQASGFRLRAALVRGDKTTWLLRSFETAASGADGRSKLVQLAADFAAAMDKAPAKEDAKDEPSGRVVSPPAGWEAAQDGSCYASRNDGLLMATPLADADRLNETMLGNFLLANLGLDELSADSIKELWTDESVGETKVRVFTSPATSNESPR